MKQTEINQMLKNAPPDDQAEEVAQEIRVSKWKPDFSIPKLLFRVVLPLIMIIVAWYGYQWWTVGRYIVSTDDAYIRADNAALAAKVPGYIASLEVADNARLKKGDIIARIDEGDYSLAVKAAQNNIASQQATIDRIGRQVQARKAALDQTVAQLVSEEAGAVRAAAELKRQRDLAKRSFTSRQTLEQAEAGNAQAIAAVNKAKAAVEAAKAEVEVAKAQEVEAQGILSQLKTALEKAERDMSFTIIRAPFDGVLGNRSVQVGDYVQPGQRLASLIRLDDIYIDANFKETQIFGLKPGQPVEITVDAVPDHIFHGQVVSFSPASGSVFSLLPPDNATGNFTKVVQRIPVRIHVDRREGEHELLRPGMSVIVNVNTREPVKKSRQAEVCIKNSATC